MNPSSAPDAKTDAAIAPLSVLPIFYRLKGRKALVAGGGEPASWKAELLAAAGAEVLVCAAQPSEKMQDALARWSNARCETRCWTPDDLRGAALAICDAESAEEEAEFIAAGRTAGVPVNVIDKLDGSDFQFGAIINRSPLVVSVSTDGAAPVLAQAIRARIEALFPAPFAAWAQAARLWRSRVAELNLPFRARRAFWERFVKRAFAGLHRAPDEKDFHELMEEETTPPRLGKVFLVGAGPGDPELLTLRAVRALQTADAVLYDDLISPGVLDFARREAHRIHVGKRGHKPSCAQDTISAKLVELALQGKTIVRLKGGDPGIFGRANEEIEILRENGVAVEIIPGVTAASGAAAALTTSLTERDLARRLQFVTAHSREGELPEDLNWSALADPKATTAVYMGVRTMALYIAHVRAAGLAETTPAIVVEGATWETQRIIAGDLATIVDATERAAPSGPCLLLIGAALEKAKILAQTRQSA